MRRAEGKKGVDLVRDLVYIKLTIAGGEHNASASKYP